MLTVRYRAYDLNRKIETGAISATSEQAAIDALYGRQLTPFETRVVRGSARTPDNQQQTLPKDLASEGSQFRRDRRVGLKDLASFTSELASLTQSGVTIDDALRIVSGAGSSRAIAHLGGAILKEMLAGSQLSETLERRGTVFAADYRAIILAGEASGAVSEALTQMANLLSRRLEIRNKIMSAMLYPLILLAMSVMSIGMITVFLLPSLAPIFTDANRPLPPILATLIQLQQNWIILAATAGVASVALAIVGQAARRNVRILTQIDRMKLALPIAGGLIRMRDAGRFARALGTLLTAGVSLIASLHTAHGLVQNRRLAAGYGAALARVPEGAAIHLALQPYDLIPAPALRLFAIGEETGQLGAMLLRAASLIEADHLRRTERLLGLLTPLLTLVIGGAVGVLIMSVMSAVMSINELAFQ